MKVTSARSWLWRCRKDAALRLARWRRWALNAL